MRAKECDITIDQGPSEVWLVSRFPSMTLTWKLKSHFLDETWRVCLAGRQDATDAWVKLQFGDLK